MSHEEEIYKLRVSAIRNAVTARLLANQYERVMNEAKLSIISACDSCPAVKICDLKKAGCDYWIEKWAKDEQPK